MLDRLALRIAKPALEAGARFLARRGIGADSVTLAGFALGILAAALIAGGHSLLAVGPLFASRLADGLDGALARQTQTTDRGAFLDIALDFLFYASIPLAFAAADPAGNGFAAAVLLFAFMGTATSFLAFATLAARRGLASTAYPSKGIYYLGGLTEGTETILCFAAMCLWPHHFAALACAYAAPCALTTLTRLAAGWRLFT